MRETERQFVATWRLEEWRVQVGRGPRRAAAGYIPYCGTFEVRGDSVVHRRS